MSLKRQFFWSIAPLLVVSVVNLFSVRLFYRYLGAEMYALWFYVGTLIGMFGFADLGLGVAVGRYIGLALGRGDHEAVREYWGTGNLVALPLVAVMALAFSSIGIVFGPHWFNVSPENRGLLRACFAAAGPALFCNYYGQLWTFLLQAHLEFRFLSLLGIAVSLLQVLPAIGIAWLTHRPLLVILWSLLISMSQLGILVWHCRRHLRLGFELRMARRARASEMAAFTGKTFATLILGALTGSIDRFVLGKLAAPAAFAHYTIASNAGVRIQGLSVATMGPVFHNTSRALGARGETSAADVYNHSFDFTIGWYVLVAVWATAWHPIVLRLWLGQGLGAAVAPVFPPIIIAFCLTGIGSISAAQLGPLNRLGAGLFFTTLNCVLVVAGVYVGWRARGSLGVAYGFLFSRLGFFAQDIFVIRLIGGGGWLKFRTWLHIGGQCAVGAGLATAYLAMPANSLWLILPAVLHGGLVAVWLLRQPLRKIMAGSPLLRRLLPPKPGLNQCS